MDDVGEIELCYVFVCFIWMRPAVMLTESRSACQPDRGVAGLRPGMPTNCLIRGSHEK